MTEMLFDTQKVVDQLVDAGVSPPQARAYASVLADVIGSVENHCVNRYASKDTVTEAIAGLDARLTKFEAEVKAEFATVRAEIKSGLASLQSEMMQWVLTVVVAAGFIQTALIVGLLLKLLP